MNGRVVNETDDGSLFSSCVIVRLQSTMSGNCFYFFKSIVDDVLEVVTLQEQKSVISSALASKLPSMEQRRRSYKIYVFISLFSVSL